MNRDCDYVKLVNVLDNYLASNDISIPIAKFLHRNPYLLDPSETNLNSNAIRLWHMIMAFLLNVDDNESKLASSTILSLVNNANNKTGKSEFSHHGKSLGLVSL
jgi:hypothetical protein